MAGAAVDLVLEGELRAAQLFDQTADEEVPDIRVGPPSPGREEKLVRGDSPQELVCAPRLGPPKPVPGPPKRFAQAMGVVFSVTAAVLALGFGLRGVAYAVMGGLLVAASLEAFLGYCLGCKIFALLMRTGVIPESVCEECNDIWGRSPGERQAA